MQDTLLDKMPETMRKDVDKLLEDVPPTRKRPERFTRKEQAKQALAGPSAAPATTSNAGAPSKRLKKMMYCEQSQFSAILKQHMIHLLLSCPLALHSCCHIDFKLQVYDHLNCQHAACT